MTKYIIIFLMLISFSGYSQLKLESGFGLMYSPKEAYRVDNKIFTLNKITALNQMRLSNNDFTLISNIAVMMDRTKEKITYTPSLASFDLELRYIKNKFMFSLAHKCVHPISTAVKELEFSIYGGYDLKVRILYNIQ